MRYIRTEDSVFRIDNDKISVINGCQFVSIRGGILHALDVKDKVADTIEELCDEFIAITLYNASCGIKAGNHYRIFKEELEKYQPNPKTYEIYGAIWTNKGLIFVAKMNEDGVLCLI